MPSKKRKVEISMAEVLEELKTSVFSLYQWRKIKFPVKLRQQVSSIAVNDILPYFTNDEHKDWHKLNDAYNISSYRDYLQWLNKNIVIPDQNGQLIARTILLKKAERIKRKKLVNTWTKLHSAFFIHLNPQVLKFLHKQYEEKHLIDKSAGLLTSDPLSRETKEEVRFDFYSLVQQVSNNSLHGPGQSTLIPNLPSKASPLFWIRMLSELVSYRYLHEDYTEDLIKRWIASSLSFTKTNIPTSVIHKLKWIGPATAFAEWIKEVQKRLIDPKYTANSHFLKWVETTIEYPGTKEALRSALSSTTKYKSKYFTFSGETETIHFAVNMFPRASKAKKR